MKKSKDEILNEIKTLELALKQCNAIIDEQFNKEQSIKTLLNSIYGAFGTPYFSFFNPDIAESITLEAKEIILHGEKTLNHYFKNLWVGDKSLHEKLGIKVDDNCLIEKELVKYVDTDSADSQTVIHLDIIGNKTFEEIFTIFKKFYPLSIDFKGNQIIDLKGQNILIQNFIDNKIVYSPLTKLFRHRVTKPKWKLKTKSGKEEIVTNDHSLVVFRNGKQLEIKASEINIKTDKILTII